MFKKIKIQSKPFECVELNEKFWNNFEDETHWCYVTENIRISARTSYLNNGEIYKYFIIQSKQNNDFLYDSEVALNDVLLLEDENSYSLIEYDDLLKNFNIIDNSNILIYVAGAYTDSNYLNVLKNMRKGINKCIELLRDHNYIPFCPWLDYLLFLMNYGTDISIYMIRAYSMEFLRRSDAILLVEGYENSIGTKEEIEEANRLNIPIFKTIEELNNYFKKGNNYKNILL